MNSGVLFTSHAILMLFSESMSFLLVGLYLCANLGFLSRIDKCFLMNPRRFHLIRIYGKWEHVYIVVFITLKVVNMALLIEDRELASVYMSEEELRLEIAIMLYEKGKLSMGKAGHFAGMNRILFQKELAKRKIPVNYDEEELMRDLATLGIA